jgi:hypothetical protein
MYSFDMLPAEYGNGFTINNELSVLKLGSSLEATVSGIVLAQVHLSINTNNNKKNQSFSFIFFIPYSLA